MDRPVALQEAVFTRLFEQAEIAKFSPQEMRDYRESQKDYWDLFAVTETAERKGREAERIKFARMMKQDGDSIEKISRYTGLTVEEIETL